MTLFITSEEKLRRFYAFRLFVVYLVSLLWLPATTAFAGQQTTPFIGAMSFYRYEAIIVASFAMLLIGSFLATRYSPPIDVPAGSKMDVTTKFLFSVAGGVAAFMYVLDEKKTLTILHPVWVFGVSVVAPSFIQTAFPFIIKLWYKFLKVKAGD